LAKLADKEPEARQQEIELTKIELQMREEELNRQKLKDETEKKCQESLVSQTRFHGEAMKHSLPKMGNGPNEFPAYSKAVEICILCMMCLRSSSLYFLFPC